MEDEIIEIKVQSTLLSTLDKGYELFKWALSKPDIVANMTGSQEGSWWIQLDGTTSPTVRAKLGDRVIWDGSKFTVEPPVG